MLYLAEVKKTTGFVKNKTELKLLACQRSEQNWSGVSGEEIIPAETPEANNLGAGAVVLVDLNANKQLQRILDNRQLVTILQNFSKLQEKLKTNEEEIEQWKQSLTYQSQELNRREMEMEARREQLQQLEEDFEQLEQQRQDVEGTREELTRLQEVVERKSHELEGAWEHLRGEQRRLEEGKAPVLDAEKSHRIQELLDRLSGAIAPTDAVREQLNLGFSLVDGQQNTLNQHWQTLEEQRASAQQLQQEVDHRAQEVHGGWQGWHVDQDALEQVRTDLRLQQGTLTLKQEQMQSMNSQLQGQNELYQHLRQLAEAMGQGKVEQKVDVEALEKMPLADLEAIVQDLQRDLEKISLGVNAQEEELTLQIKTIDELQARIQSASEFDRLSLEGELADERESYQLLEDSVVGVRRNLGDRAEVLSQHQAVLMRRQGRAASPEIAPAIDLKPVLAQMESLQQRQTEAVQALEQQIGQLQAGVQGLQDQVNARATDQENRRNELRQLEQSLQAQQRAVAELWGRVNVYQETLQPTQDAINELRQKLEAMAAALTHVQETTTYQLQSVTEMREVFVEMIGTPEMATS